MRENRPRPKFSWTFEKDGSIKVKTSDKPTEVKVWVATNPDKRDFRLASIGQGVFKRNLIGIGNAPASGDNAHTKHLAATACAILDR